MGSESGNPKISSFHESSSEMTVLFLHIEKTGGTSVTQVLKRWAKRPCSGGLNERIDFEADFVYGHFDYGLHEHFEEAEYITILRDPISRMVSHYCHIATRRDHPHYYLVGDFENFLSLAEEWELTDFQTRRLGGDLSLAKDRLDEFAVVGVTERMEEFGIALNRRYGCPAEIPRKNRGSYAGDFRRYRDRVEEMNQKDMELYTHALSIILQK